MSGLNPGSMPSTPSMAGRLRSAPTTPWLISSPASLLCRSRTSPAKCGNIAGASTCWRGSSRSRPASRSTSFCRAACSGRCVWSTRDSTFLETSFRFDIARPRKLLSGGGGLDGVRVLTPKAVREMTSDQLPPNIRFAGNSLGPDTGSSWGLGFKIRTDPEHSYVPGSVCSFRWSGLCGTYFWVDPAEKLIAVEMIQAAPGKAGPAFGAIRRLTYGALRVPAPADFVAPPSPPGVSADTLAEYVGKYAFGSSSSAHDLQADHPRLGFEKLDVENGVFKVSRMTDGGPAMKAGVMAGDLIIQLDDLRVDSSSLDAADALLEAHDVPSLKLKIMRKGEDKPVEITLVRKLLSSQDVELQVRVDAGKVVVESTGVWPILDFDKGKPVVLSARSDHEFFADTDDHTRIAFVRDAAGKVAAAVLNPGPLQQEGGKVE